MKIILILTTLFASYAYAETSCLNSERYQQRVDLDGGETLFINPGLYTEGKNYRTYCSDASAHPNYRCTPDVTHICKYLGFTKAVSWSIDHDYSNRSFMRFKDDGTKVFFKADYVEAHISEVICK